MIRSLTSHLSGPTAAFTQKLISFVKPNSDACLLSEVRLRWRKAVNKTLGQTTQTDREEGIVLLPSRLWPDPLTNLLQNWMMDNRCDSSMFLCSASIQLYPRHPIVMLLYAMPLLESFHSLFVNIHKMQSICSLVILMVLIMSYYFVIPLRQDLSVTSIRRGAAWPSVSLQNLIYPGRSIYCWWCRLRLNLVLAKAKGKNWYLPFFPSL